MTTSAARHNQAYYEKGGIVRRYASMAALLPAEEALLERLRGELREGSLLDIGVGGGRTTVHFAPAVSSYTGADYASAMVEACRARFAEDLPKAEWAVADARSLPPAWIGRYDAAMFSYNGIDCLDPEDRPQALKEMRRALKPGGWLLFSFHNLAAVADLGGKSRRGGLGDRLRARFERAAYRWLNPDLEERLRAPMTLLRDRGNRWRGRYTYIRPEAQARQLEEAGFEWVDAYPATGRSPYKSKAEALASVEPWVYVLALRRD
jgi:SAM-dependent methyltransferase